MPLIKMTINKSFGLICILYALSQHAFGEPIPQDDNSLLRNTKSGSVEGLIETTILGKEVISFYGIPYAKPPLGELRFKPPEPVEPWTGVIKAQSIPEPCYQQYNKYLKERLRSTNQLLPRPWSEDCLKINIWVPSATDPEQPVLVIFHEGAFSFGSGTSSILPSSSMAVETKSVIVTVNYRLGAFGFLGAGHPDAAGNMGLLDQQLALKWVNENIEVFSGKSAAIFVMGYKSGAASAGFHAISKSSAGLFVTAGLLQGSPNCHWAYDDPEISLKKANLLADQLGCKCDNMTNTIACLRSKHPEDIMSAAVEENLKFKPTIDGIFLTESPIDAIRSGRINNVTTGIVTSSDEGSLSFLRFNSDILKTKDARLNRFYFRKAIKRLIPNVDGLTMQALEVQYLNRTNPNDPLVLRDAAREIYADYQTDCCMNEYTHLVAGNKKNVVRALWVLEMKKSREWMGALSTAQSECLRGSALLGEKMGYTKLQQQSCYEYTFMVQYVIRKKIEEILAIFPPYSIIDRNYVTVGNHQEIKNNYKVEQCAALENILHHK